MPVSFVYNLDKARPFPYDGKRRTQTLGGNMKEYYTRSTNFFGETNPEALLEIYGSPLYVYNENILRQRCREMVGLVRYRPFTPDYSCKANSNRTLLRIIREEGLHGDAMSPGEILALLEAGYKPDEIFFVCNNISAEEMAFAVERGILVSCDSLSQLEQFGRYFPGERVAVRINPGIGIGYHDKVITAGKRTKFGVTGDDVTSILPIVEKYGLKLVGLNQHLGSLFMEESQFVMGVKAMLDTCRQFKNLEFIDLGGGFGIPYHKQDGQAPLDLIPLSRALEQIMTAYSEEMGKAVDFRIEPGRYIVAECGLLLGTVHTIKENGENTFAGTDLGFNVLQRVMLYDSHHDIEVYRGGKLLENEPRQEYTVVGNICESGDKLAVKRSLPRLREEDLLGLTDTGAYGYSMASNYNLRLRPAEVLIAADGSHRLIRKRDSYRDLFRGFEDLD